MDEYDKYIIFALCVLNKTKLLFDKEQLERDLIGFTPEAKRYWIALFNEIESNLGACGRFQNARDHGSKLAENIARTAALLAYVELGEGEEITLGILMDATRIVFFFSDTYLRYFQTLPEGILDAAALSEYLQSEREDGNRYIRKNKIRQSGPSRLRNSETLNKALTSLQLNNELCVHKIINTGMLVVDLYPHLSPDPHQWDAFLRKNKIFRNDRIINADEVED